MPNRYFQKFPNTFYSNTNCLDITRRPVMTDNITTTPILYQEYTIQSGARPDLMAENYYEDPYCNAIEVCLKVKMNGRKSPFNHQ